MITRSKRKPFAERLKIGLTEAAHFANGKLTLRTVEIPDPPPEIAAREVASLRTRVGMSQSVFARVLNVSTKTVQSWEQGVRKPSQAALRLLQVYRQNPSGLLEVVGMPGRKRDPSGGKRTAGRTGSERFD